MPARPRKPSSEELLEGLRTALTSRLPSSWSVDVQRHTGAYAANVFPDAMLMVRAPDGRQATVPVEIKQKLDPKDVGTLIARVHEVMESGGTERPLVVAPYFSIRTRKLLADGGLSYVTSPFGSVRLQLNDPAVYIDATDDDERDPLAAPRDQPLRTLRGPVAGRVVRALCDFRPPYGVQALAERSNTPIASVSRVLALLDREALVTRTPGGAVTDVQWAELIQRWTQDYSFGKANTVATYLEPRGLPALLGKLRQAEHRYAVTSSQAASLLAPVAAPRLLSIYVERFAEAASSFGLRQAERGANVILAEPFNSVAFDRTQAHDGITYAAPSQVAADLLTGPGRSPAEGEALLQWMKDNEGAWRY